MHPPFPGARVLVTGASGFVGRELLRRLSAAGWRVLAAARDGTNVPRGERIEAAVMPDLAARSPDWGPLLADVTHIVHLAGLAHMTRGIPEAVYMAVNAEATVALAAAAQRAGVARLVLVSSIRAQVGPVAAHVVRESDMPAPTDAYGRSKLAAEMGMWRALKGDAAKSAVVLRPVLVHGPGVKGNLAALARLARWPVPLPIGALRNRRSLVSLANLASAIGHALTAPAPCGGTFLVADPEPVSVPDIIAALRAGLGRGRGLIDLPLAPAAAALRLIGRDEIWDRLAGDLVADTGAFQATGWRASEATLEALARDARFM